MTTHDTRSQLLAEIAARPEDDTARLAFADWLDEHGDAADADRAEFVRVQCELERYRRTETEWQDKRRSNPYMRSYGGNCDCFRLLERQRPCPFCVAQRRERKLIDTHPEWSRCPCPECGEKGKLVRRGVVGQSIAALNPVCPTCNGTGDLFVEAPRDLEGFPPNLPRAVTFARGFADAVHCTLAEAFGGDGTPTSWAVAVVRQTPVVRFRMTDRTARNIPWEVWTQFHTPPKTIWLESVPSDEGEAADILALAAGRLVRRHAYRGKP